MKKINLRDLFPDYELDCYIEVPDGDAEAYAAAITRAEADVFIQFERAEIARIEGVHKMSVTDSITRGLRNLEKYLKNIPKQTLLSL